MMASGAAELARLRRLGAKHVKHGPTQRSVTLSLEALNSGCMRTVTLTRRRVDEHGIEYDATRNYYLVIRCVGEGWGRAALKAGCAACNTSCSVCARGVHGHGAGGRRPKHLTAHGWGPLCPRCGAHLHPRSKGSRQGDVITFEGDGDETVDTQPGDLCITLQAEPHPKLRRAGGPGVCRGDPPLPPKPSTFSHGPSPQRDLLLGRTGGALREWAG